MPDEFVIDKKHQPFDEDLKITSSIDDSVSHKEETDSEQSGQKKNNHRHDTTFKLAMGHLPVAKEMIRTYLPLTATKTINFNTLAVCPASYIDQDHQVCHAYILYRAKSVDGDDAYIYFIWEHQSTYDKQMPFRLLRYTCQIMHDHIKAGYDTLPIVIPALLYNGKKSPYPGSCDIFDGFDGFDNPDLARAQMFKPFHLLDLSVTTNEELMQARWSALPNLILKHMHKRDFLKAIGNTLPVILRYLYEQGGKIIAEDMLECIMRYTSASSKQDLLEVVKEGSREAGDRLMTLFDKLIQEGIDLGREKARQDIIKNLLLDGMDAHRISKLLNIDCDDIEAIKLSLDH
jgi:predicted transposase/invertase (TIGR01784 family)